MLVRMDPGAGPRTEDSLRREPSVHSGTKRFLLLIVPRDPHGEHNCLSEDPTPRNPSKPQQLLF